MVETVYQLSSMAASCEFSVRLLAAMLKDRGKYASVKIQRWDEENEEFYD